MPALKLISLGCSKNTVDSEIILAHVLPAHWDLLPVESRKYADAVLINTCGFIGDAKQESIDMILRAGLLKAKGRIGRLYVMGCLAQRYGQE
ncbi:MAG: 30S ribosomal protein S12 methylthiotransferase RimO, partial [Bacteroidales bacterium]|nr:30S ribosomal protein S12 methylthiotransferase RimO [Bacteroidales bacterium]